MVLCWVRDLTVYQHTSVAHPGILVTTKSGKSGKVLQGSYGGVRVYNFFINKVLEQIENGTLSETDEVKNYLGEAYFFRALNYFKMLACYGDLPIVTEVLPDENDAIVASSCARRKHCSTTWKLNMSSTAA